MRKKNFYLLLLTLALVGASTAVALGAVLRHEPTFYERAQVPAGAERKKLSDSFFNGVAQLLADVTKNRDGGKWRHSFTEAQINSFFEEDFVRWGEADNFRKHGVSAPRILLEDDKLRLAFRYGTGFWSTVVSYDLRLWIVPREPNTIAVQILSRRLGALPLSSQALLSEMAEVARRHNINMETTLYRHEGYPVALVRFQSDGSRAPTSLHCLKINAASLIVAGGSSDGDAPACPDKKCPTPSAP
jgi:hypothetical protein